MTRPLAIDLSGQRFGRLVVLGPGTRVPSGGLRWHCRCDCGRETQSLGNNLRHNAIMSCGCVRKPHRNGPLPRDPKQRIESSIIVAETGCWEWTRFRTRDGYGQIKIPGHGTRPAHRIAYEAFVGKIPDGMQVLHRCDVRHCVNPDHLFLGDQRDNVHDMMAKNRAPQTKGSPVGIPKLTESEVRQIRADTRSRHVLAAQYGVTLPTIRRVKRGDSWRHVT